jgi:hypothetical protein
MNALDRARRLLDEHGGFRCVPTFMRRYLWSVVQNPWEPLADEQARQGWVSRYVQERLGVIERFIEPLAADPAAGGQPDFAAFCDTMRDVPDRDQLASQLEVPTDMESQKAGYFIWLWWAWLLQEKPAASLYCLATFWMIPGFRDDFQGNWLTGREAHAVRLTATALQSLGHGPLASALVEIWLGIAAEATVARQRLADTLPASPLQQIDEPEVEAELIFAWVSALLGDQARGWQHARAVLEAWLGIEPDDYADRARLAGRLTASRPLQRLRQQEMFGACAQALGMLTNVLKQRPRGGFANLMPEPLREEAIQPDHGKIAIVWESWLGIEPAVYDDRRQLAEALARSPLARVGKSHVVGLILGSLAGALRHDLSRNNVQSVALLENWLGLDAETYASPEAVAGALGRLPNEEPGIPAEIMRTLADGLYSLEERPPEQLNVLLKTWLRIPDPLDCPSPDAVWRTLQSGPLGTILDSDSAAHLLWLLADSLRGQGGPGASQAAALLEAWLGISQEDYNDQARLDEALPRTPLDGPSAQLETWLAVVRSLALALAEARGAQPAVALVEAWRRLPGPSVLTIPPETIKRLLLAIQLDNVKRWDKRSARRFLEAWLGVTLPEDSKGCPFVTQTLPLFQWLERVWEDHPETISTCELLARFLRDMRETYCASDFQRRQCILHGARPLGDLLQTIGLARADAERRAGHEAEATALEQRVLVWAELFENRRLLDQFLEQYGRPGAREPAPLAGWQPEVWPLPVTRPTAAPFHEGYLPPSGPAPWPGGWATPLGSRPDSTAQPIAQPDSRERDPSTDPQRQRLLELAEEVTELDELLPRTAVWVRTLFDHDGTLRWWACRRGPAGMEVLARGQSQPDADKRLAQAAIALDTAIAVIWEAYRHHGPLIDLEPDQERALAAVPQMLADEGVARSVFDNAEARKQMLGHLLATLKALKRPGLTFLGLLEQTLVTTFLLDRQGTAPPELIRVFRESVQTVCQGWQEPLGPLREERRRRELDRSTGQHIQTLQAEMNLEPLWQALPQGGWADCDIVFQVQGPLLTAPLAWLPFGGREMFRQVASTSTIVSLTLRHLADQEARAAGAPAPRMLSAHWLPAQDWKRMLGLANLHEALLRIAPLHGWQVCGLGTAPPASAHNLRTLFANQQSPFGLVVVGGHGDEHAAGVALSDGLWCGDGADLSRVDLLLLVACAVGRLHEEDNSRDIKGLYTQLAAHRCRSVIAARWPIADTEAATFAAEVVHRYLAALRGGAPVPFARSRALNQARRELVDHPSNAVRVSSHVASAFEIFGRG